MILIGVMGPSRCGKDEFAEWMVKNTTLTYQGTTSVVISREVARRENKSFEQAHAERHLRKVYWRKLGDEMREHDPAALARQVLVGSNLLVGVRGAVEIDAVRKEGLVDIIYWIDRPSCPFDPTLEFNENSCDAIIPNWWGLVEYHSRLRAIAKSLKILI